MIPNHWGLAQRYKGLEVWFTAFVASRLFERERTEESDNGDAKGYEKQSRRFDGVYLARW